jgi:hypothetical protein
LFRQASEPTHKTRIAICYARAKKHESENLEGGKKASSSEKLRGAGHWKIKAAYWRQFFPFPRLGSGSSDRLHRNIGPEFGDVSFATGIMDSCGRVGGGGVPQASMNPEVVAMLDRFAVRVQEKQSEGSNALVSYVGSTLTSYSSRVADVYPQMLASPEGRQRLLGIVKELVRQEEWGAVYAFLTKSPNYDDVEPLGRVLYDSELRKSLMNDVVEKLPADGRQKLESFSFTRERGDGWQELGLFWDGMPG